MISKLQKMAEEALNESNNGNMEKAVEIYEKIIFEEPNYENGYCYYNLACCLEEINQLNKAEENYLKAYKYYPEDIIVLGGYASFLYLHGDPHKAFKFILELFNLEKKTHRNTDGSLRILNRLAEKIGLSKEQISTILNSQ